jgi:glycosyltransferase involved in cell wall biosynthesis
MDAAANDCSVIVITKDEEANIASCLASVAWAREIVIVDAGSTDRTVEIAQAVTSKVFVRPWDGFGPAKNFALNQATGEWILWLDADERVTETLRDELVQAMRSAATEVTGFTMPRRANFLGAWISHCGWYPGRVTRLFRRQAGRFSQHRVHERLELTGTIMPLTADLLHYTDPDLFHYYEKFNRYTTLAAEELYARGGSFRLRDLIVRPLWTFIRMYVLRLGFLDGIAGLILCSCSAGYVFTKYAKLWEHPTSPSGEQS